MVIRLLRGPAMRVAVGLALAVVSLAASGATNVWTGTVNTNWFEPGNWSLSVVPTNEADVSVPVVVAAKTPLLTNATASLASFVLASNQVLNVSGWTSAITAREMTIRGIIRHASNTALTTNSAGEWVPDSRIWLQGSNIAILAGAQLFGDYRGYPTNSGPGRGLTGTGGAAHSGDGRRGAGSAGGLAYDDPAEPEQPGSGGGGPSNTYAGVSRPGGGAIRIEATGNVTLQGTLTVKGQNGGASHGSGGSGGSVWVTCQTFQGTASGLIAVDGGGGDRTGAGASGGRIAIAYDPAAQSGLAEPCPPIRFSGTPGYRGNGSDYLLPPMGSLYFPDTTLLGGAFTAKRFQNVKLMIQGFTNWAPASLTLNDCIIGLPDGFHLAVAGDLLLTNGGALHVYAAATTNPLTAEGALVEVGGNLVVGSNSWIYPYAEPTNGAIVKFAVTGDLVVAAGGGLDADYKGYMYGKGPGTAVRSMGGGGYGGIGSDGFDGDRNGGAYGAAEGPVQAGSGGGPGLTTGQGGGAIRIVVGQRAVIEGLLSAAGAPGMATHGSAGSGGGISVECRTFEGAATGLLRAEGGLGEYYGGSGGGGRIAVLYDPSAQSALPEPRPPVRFSTYAYPYSSRYAYPYKAEMGTLFFPDTTLLFQSVTSSVAWDGRRFWHVRPVVSDFTNWTPASLTVSNCVVRFPEGFHLAVAGNLTLRQDAALHVHAAATNGMMAYGSLVEVGGNLAMASNAWVIPQAHPTNGALVRVRVAGDATIDPYGGINADGRGYNPVLGNTNGPGPGRDIFSGGGHGGLGGGALGGYSNGVAALPLGPGSPGGWYGRADHTSTGQGGGAIILMVGGNLVLNGTLTSDGNAGVYYRGPSGSGGAILVTAWSLSGSGVMRASGGASGYATTGSGGGGRIAVWYNLPLQTADTLIAQQSFKFLTYQSTHPDFAGTMLVETGSYGVAGTVGTKGFYRYAVTGTLMLVR